MSHDVSPCATLDPREQTWRIDGPVAGLKLFLRRLASQARPDTDRVVLYVHGATFPSALSIAHRMRGRSWRDALCDAGFHVWAFDFYGFGGSDRYPEMDAPAADHGPLGLAADAARQLEAVVRFVLAHENVPRVALLTHSWGSMPAGIVAAEHPTLIDRLFLFAPLARRSGPRYVPRPTLPAWKLVSNEDQWARFVEDVPAHESPVLSRDDFDAWAAQYLASDPDANDRSPPAVKTPTGPLTEILRAWHGELAWQPERVQAPVAIARGSWDGVCADTDARWLFAHLDHARERRLVEIGRGTHLMHLETMREALWRESIAFLGADTAVGTDHASSSTHSGDGTMQDHHETKDLAGYNPGSPDVARSPITMDELRELMATCLFGDEDRVYLRLSYDVLKDQADALVVMWRDIIAQHVHLARYSWDEKTGEPDKDYGVAVGKRFAQWVLDTARAEYDQAWLDYQYEIGLRHHRTKKNRTDHARTTPHIRGRDMIGFAAATVAPMRPYLEKGGHSPDVVLRMQQAWWKSMILQVTLWSQPYMNAGDF